MLIIFNDTEKLNTEQYRSAKKYMDPKITGGDFNTLLSIMYGTINRKINQEVKHKNNTIYH